MRAYTVLLVCAALAVTHAEQDLENIINDMLEDVEEFEEDLTAFREAVQNLEGSDNTGEPTQELTQEPTQEPTQELTQEPTQEPQQALVTELPAYFDYIGSYQKHSYYLIHENRQTWDDARASCQAAGMDLIALETTEEHQWLRNNWASGGFRTCWAGAYESTVTSPRQFLWAASGEGVDMDQEGLWVGGAEPHHHGWHCAFFTNYQLSDYFCHDMDCYLCETTDSDLGNQDDWTVHETTEEYIYYDFDVQHTTETYISDPSGFSCGSLSLDAPDVYIHGNRCYLIVSQSLDWDSARANCQEKGMDLATIDSAATQEFLERIIDMGSNRYSHIWMGAQRDGSGTFRWVALNNAAVDDGYTNWHEGEPNNFEGYEGCMLIWDNYQWNDAGCEHHRPYICQGHLW